MTAQPAQPALLRHVARHRNAEWLNRVVNDPSVREWVLADTSKAVDLTSFVANPANIVLGGKHGAIAFEQLTPGVYEAHTQVLPAGRGGWAASFVLACLHWMFAQTDAVEITTRVPQGNVAARAGIRMLEHVFGPLFELRRERGWLRNGEHIPADVYVLHLSKWMLHAPGLYERGTWFHRRLEEEYARLGKQEDLHEDDSVHDRAVGAACELLIGGQAPKAVVFYNRWAALAGYAPISLTSVQPLVVNIRDALLLVRPGEQNFWVMV